MASGMCAITNSLMALVPAGGHVVTTTDCCWNTRRFTETWLPEEGIRVYPADVGALESVLEQNNVNRVYYPELSSHPEHELAKRQMTGYGGVVSFEIDGDLRTTETFVDSLKIPYIAPTCSHVLTGIFLSQKWAEYGIHDNLVRYSFGV